MGSDVSLSGSVASITSWSANSDNTVYTATITPTASGTVTVGVAANVATDAANNQNTAATSKTVTVDVDSPTVTISVPSETQHNAFNTTITFSEAVSNFVASDVSLSGSAASITSWSANNGNTVYTATITPTASGTVTVGVAANVANDAANNPNTAAISQTVTVDIDKPSVTIGVPSGTQTGAFDATIMFSETVSGFVGSDVSLTGSAASITGWSANIDNTVYTATITPTASGTVTIGVVANVATDGANNQNTAATPKTVTVSVDTDAPGVSVSVPSGVQNGAFNATITFTESVSGFTQSKLSLTGTVNASITAWQTTDNTTYTATITPTSSGTVTLNVSASVATDAANNPNTAATAQTVTVDVDKPTVTISVSSGTQTSTFNAIITFSEAVSGFGQSDVFLTGSEASITAWNANSDNTTYTVTITPTASGTVTVSVNADVATDAAGNNNTAATSKNVTVNVDTNAPDVSIAVPSGVQNGAFNATIAFTEAVSGFGQSEVSLTGSAASITAWNANTDNTVYTATITPTASGTVTVGVDANVATDAANNQNTAATSQTVTVDVDRPTASISVPSDVQNSAFDATITFSEAVSGFVGSDVSLTGSAASITVWSANIANTVYTTTITPTASGTITIGVAANVATDAANNPNTAATSKTVAVDVDAPTVTIDVPSGTQNGAFDATITFTETVSGFVGSEVSLSGSSASITSWSANSDDTVYTATITPTASGTVTIGVAANVATDAANNQNTTATSKTVSVDVDKPTVTIRGPSGTQTGAFDVTITFSETVSGFAQSEVSLSGSAASITSWSANSDSTVYTATITPTISGTVTIGVAASVATDAANNTNIAATSITVTTLVVQALQVDTTSPGVSILVPSSTQTGAFDVTIEFTETVSGFVQSEVSLSGSTASITSWSANSDDTVYTAMITPTASGTVTIGVAANVAIDAANNPNTAAATQTVTVNLDSPSATLVLLPEVENNRIDVQITFNEPVEGFESTDLSVTTNGLTQLDPRVIGGETTIDPPPIVSITGWTPNPNKKAYTVYITTYTKTEGQVIINVPADVATDVAGNPNVAGSALSVDEEPGLYLFLFQLDPDGNFSQGDSSGCHVSRPERLRDYLDVNKDGSIDEDDVALVEAALGQFGDGITNSRTDINCDNTVDNKDLALVDDTEGPTFSISVPTDTQSSSAFDIVISFNEIVFDFDVNDISLTGSTATATVTSKSSSWGNSGTITHRFEVTPTTSGDLVISVPAGAAKDALDNPNTASSAHTVTIDMGIPSVSSMTSTSVDVGSGVFKITITFSEAVSGFEQADLRVSGAGTSITAWETTDNITFTATITATTSGWVYYYVPVGVATDAEGKSNTASNRYSREVDLDPPSVEVSVPTDEQSGAFDITIIFIESVYNFEQDDVSLADSTAAATITDWTMVDPLQFWLAGKGHIEPRSVYEATINPTTSGTVTISVPADVATDRAGNNNTASDTHSITVSLPGSRLAPASLSGIVLDPTVLKTLDPEVLEAHLDILRAGSDGSLKYLQAIALLESVLAEMRPEKTVLLANYPNPFNPETWIPYQLASDTDVQLSIYDINGGLVRRLNLGHQRAGYYTDRSRAAYWDGTNEFGERAASGIYFYTLTARDFSATRKMLIGK